MVAVSILSPSILLETHYSGASASFQTVLVSITLIHDTVIISLSFP